MDVNSGSMNGQNKGEKYSLRPRVGERGLKVKTQRIEEDYAGAVGSKNNDCKFQKISKIKTNDNVKQKPASLSKYRRKTANARERSRMREINLAFETLRKAVPSYMPQLVFSGDGSNEKLTKITTLRLAMKYITGLTELLHKDDRTYVIDDCNESIMECHPIIFRDTDTCTLTALNTSTYDLLNSPNYINDGGSDGESLHSGATIDNIIETGSIETLVPDVNFDIISENFFNADLS